MREAINLDGFLTPEEVLCAMRPASGKGSRLLRQYAQHKAEAMRCRLAGNISTAQWHEGLCERIYSRLPEDLKW